MKKTSLLMTALSLLFIIGISGCDLSDIIKEDNQYDGLYDSYEEQFVTVTKLPDKTVYTAGETFNPTGLEIAFYNTKNGKQTETIYRYNDPKNRNNFDIQNNGPLNVTIKVINGFFIPPQETTSYYGFSNLSFSIPIRVYE